MSELSYRGRVAIVTGAGRGIGRAHAMALARRGAKVVVNDLGGTTRGAGASAAPAEEVAKEICAAGGEAVANRDSVATTEGAAAIVRSALDAFGRIDVVVNNAGITGHEPFARTIRESFDRVVDVHLGGSYEVTRAAWPHLAKQGYGRIVMTSSASGLFGEIHHASYSSAKMGIIGLTRSLAVEGAEAAITVNAVAPAAFTRMVDDNLPNGDFKQWFAAEMPADAVAELVAWLAHEECTVSGEIFGAYGRLVVRHVVGTTRGHLAARVTAEELRDHFEEIREIAGLSFAGDANEELGRIAAALAQEKR